MLTICPPDPRPPHRHRTGTSAVAGGGRRAVGLVALALMTGCVQVPALPPAPTPVEARLVDSSARIAAALDRLARLQAAVTPRAAPAVNPTTLPPLLRTPVTLTWQGPAQTVVRQLVDRIGFRVLVHGVPPVTPVLVSLDVQDQPMVQIFEEIGLQIGARGTLRLDVDGKTVHLSFAPRSGGVF